MTFATHLLLAGLAVYTAVVLLNVAMFVPLIIRYRRERRP